MNFFLQEKIFGERRFVYLASEHPTDLSEKIPPKEKLQKRRENLREDVENTILSTMNLETFLSQQPSKQMELVTGLSEEAIKNLKKGDTFATHFSGNRLLEQKVTAGIFPKQISTITVTTGGKKATGKRVGLTGQFYNEETGERVTIHENSSVVVGEVLSTSAIHAIEKGNEEKVNNYSGNKQIAKMALEKGIPPELAEVLMETVHTDSVAIQKTLIEIGRQKGNFYEIYGLPSERNGDLSPKFLAFVFRFQEKEKATDFARKLGWKEKKIQQAEAFRKEMDETINAGGSLYAQLKREIASGEGNYNSYNRGRAGYQGAPLPRPLTQMTVGEIMSLQSPARRNRLFAVGKYQFIPKTFAGAVRYTHINVNEKFTPAVQEKMFSYLISPAKRPALAAYLKGSSNNLNAAHRELAKEFASIPGPDGRGVYDNDSAGNRAFGGRSRAGKISSLLQKIHASHKIE